jgi:hypothetical protein
MLGELTLVITKTITQDSKECLPKSFLGIPMGFLRKSLVRISGKNIRLRIRVSNKAGFGVEEWVDALDNRYVKANNVMADKNISLWRKVIALVIESEFQCH